MRAFRWRHGHWSSTIVGCWSLPHTSNCSCACLPACCGTACIQNILAQWRLCDWKHQYQTLAKLPCSASCRSRGSIYLSMFWTCHISWRVEPGHLVLVYVSKDSNSFWFAHARFACARIARTQFEHAWFTHTLIARARIAWTLLPPEWWNERTYQGSIQKYLIEQRRAREICCGSTLRVRRVVWRRYDIITV